MRRRTAATSAVAGPRMSADSRRLKTMPDRLFVRAFLLRAAGLWLGVRMMVAFLGLPGGTLLLPTGLDVSVLIVAITVALAGIELRRRDEFLLLGSIGYSPELMLGLSALPVPPLEALFTALVP